MRIWHNTLLFDAFIFIFLHFFKSIFFFLYFTIANLRKNPWDFNALQGGHDLLICIWNNNCHREESVESFNYVGNSMPQYIILLSKILKLQSPPLFLFLETLKKVGVLRGFRNHMLWNLGYSQVIFQRLYGFRLAKSNIWSHD